MEIEFVSTRVATPTFSNQKLNSKFLNEGFHVELVVDEAALEIIDVCESVGVIYRAITHLKAQSSFDCAWYIVDTRLPPDIETSVCECGESIVKKREEDLLLVGCAIKDTPTKNRYLQIEHLINSIHQFLGFRFEQNSKPYESEDEEEEEEDMEL